MTGTSGQIAPPLGESYMYGARIDAGCCTVPSRQGFTANNHPSGQLYLSFFRAPVSFAAANVRVACTTAAVATPTLVRFGIYSVAANGDLTLVGSTPNDTSVFNTANQSYQRALSAPVNLVRGAWYAAGVLQVSGAATASVVGYSGQLVNRDVMLTSPRLSGFLNSLSDLPASAAAGSLIIANLSSWADLTT